MTQPTLERHTLIEHREALWYPEPSRTALLGELHAIATDPARHRTRSIAIIAEANGGKSALIQRYMTLHPPVYGEEAVHIPAIYLSMTLFSRVEDLSVALLEAIGAPAADRGTHAARLKRFVHLARTVKLGLIFLDEFHDCADTTGRGKPFLRCIKGLIIDGLLVVPAGTQELAEVLALDAQFSTRFNFVRGRLQRVTDLGVIKSMVMAVGSVTEDDLSDAAVEYILQESRGVLGHMLDLVEETLHQHQNLTLASLRQCRKLMDVLDSVV